MKLLFTTSLLIACFIAKAAHSDTTIIYNLNDSVKAVSLIADVVIKPGKKETYAGIGAGPIQLLLERKRNKGSVEFIFPASAEIISRGLHTKKEKGELEWKFDFDPNSTYKLLIATAMDSAENFKLYSGYIYLPAENKWKIIGTCRVNNESNYLQKAELISSKGRKSNIEGSLNNAWVQRTQGSWKKLDDRQEGSKSPVISPMVNLDSVAQFQIDKKRIEAAIASGATTVKDNIEGVYYHIAEPGNGKSFTVDDSITVKYQLRIFGTSEVISGSATETYTFKLKNLIKAWQLAVPLVKAGGKIKLVIPSGLAYSIRTRAPKIPPNSILEFDIEVLDVK